MRASITDLHISGIPIPPGADFDVNEDVALIDESGSMERDINGRLVDLSPRWSRRYRVTISATTHFTPPIGALRKGAYHEVSPTTLFVEPYGVDIPPFLRANAYTNLGRVLDVTSPAPLSGSDLTPDNSTARAEFLRARSSVNLSATGLLNGEEVVAIRYRPLLACILVDASFGGAEARGQSARWSVTFEEI